MNQLVSTVLMYAALFAGMGLAYRVWLDWHRSYVRKNDVLDKLMSAERTIDTRITKMGLELDSTTRQLEGLRTQATGQLEGTRKQLTGELSETRKQLGNLLSNHEKHVSRMGAYMEATDAKLNDMATKWLAEVETFKTSASAAYIDNTKQNRPRFRP